MLIDFGNSMTYLRTFSRQIPSVTSAGGSNDEMYIVVVDEDGVLTGTTHSVLETYGFVSMASDAKDSVGNSNYYKTVVNLQSNYVYWTGHNSEHIQVQHQM